MARPWNNWYHCNGNTYGTWLRGDPRGFRERHHRRHVEGDYKKPPPPGKHDAMLERSRNLLKRAPIHLDKEQRRIAADAIVTKLLKDSIDVIAVSVDDHHFHLLARFPDHRPRHWIGRAKKHASELLTNFQLKGRVWAQGCRSLPITDRHHQINTYEYIIGHRKQGAGVWTFRDPNPNLE